MVSMNLEEVIQLHPGDEVYWNDPDDGQCSRHIIIADIDFVTNKENDLIIQIVDQDAGYLECFMHELS